MDRKRVLIFVVAYNAERTIRSVVQRIPISLAEHETHILIIDDSSKDRTFERAQEVEDAPFPMTVLVNPVNQGYGGNQKIGFHYAVRENFDYVALLHGDGQYAPECLPDLLGPLLDGDADAVFGSRMMPKGGARSGGMPLYKYAGNRMLTALQNRLLDTHLSEFHSGYRLYSVSALRKIPFELNTNAFHFDTEIIIQLLRAGLRIRECPIPTYYGDEICYVNGLRYALDVVKTTLGSKVQDIGICYERKYDVAPHDESNPLYRPKWGFESSHTLALERVRAGSKVMDVGCASGYMARALKEKGCDVTGVDQFDPPPDSGLQRFIRADLNSGEFPPDAHGCEFILLLDVIEHLRRPEKFVESLRNSRRSEDAVIIVSTANVAFFVTRLMLLMGQFRYGLRGILDLTHTRLFTFASARDLFEQAGYRISEVRGVPAPFPLALGGGAIGRCLVALNRMLIGLWKSLFAYQIFMVVHPLPSLDTLLEGAVERSKLRETASRPE